MNNLETNIVTITLMLISIIAWGFYGIKEIDIVLPLITMGLQIVWLLVIVSKKPKTKS